MSISSLADNIGELRLPDLERKVNLLSLDSAHLYSDVAWACGRCTHNERPTLLVLFFRERARTTRRAKRTKNAEKKALNRNDATRVASDIEIELHCRQAMRIA
jgi:hypothetical protein